MGKEGATVTGEVVGMVVAGVVVARGSSGGGDVVGEVWVWGLGTLGLGLGFWHGVGVGFGVGVGDGVVLGNFPSRFPPPLPPTR